MSIVSMRDMLEAGVHFGHQSRYWNPKMAPYIFGERNRIHIINLEVTLPLYREAINFLGRMAASNGTVLFVGTKRAAQEVIRREATRCGMPYVDQRWLGGMLTNFKTVRASIARLREMEAMEEDGRVQRMSKKEALSFRRVLAKLQRSLGGSSTPSRCRTSSTSSTWGTRRSRCRKRTSSAFPSWGSWTPTMSRTAWTT